MIIVSKDICILSIETSCDETSCAVVKNGREVLSNVISSQIDFHKTYGGVVPEIASRKHIESIDLVLQEALEEAKIMLDQIDAVAVTYGPGLVGALLVGISSAKALSFAIKKPLIAVHHIEGHISANYIENKELEPPFVCLVASGGHSHIVFVKDHYEYEIMGQTRDDAAGEAFDKIARALGLGYPGGPAIDKISRDGNQNAVNFPRVNFNDNKYDFSFSGLKTAVLNYINKQNQNNLELNIPDIAASFQMAVVDVLVDKTILAGKEKIVGTLALAGGVAANSLLRETLKERAQKQEFNVVYPSIILCTDNAAMIGAAAYYKYLNNDFADLDLNAVSNLKLGQK